MFFQPTEIRVRDAQKIEITFSSQPSLFITKNNFSIVSTFTGVNDLEILSISVEDFTIVINTRPQYPDNLYLIKLVDLPTQPFEDINNVELSTITDARNIYFVGVQDVNSVRDTMLTNLPANYDTGEQTLVRDVTTSMANEINNASITLQEIKNDNFISVDIFDELYFRGSGPSDRLKNEGTYEVRRVARTLTGTTAVGLKLFDPITDPNIPFEVINLRAMEIVETVPDNVSVNNFNDFLITVNKKYVTKLLSVVLSPGDIVYDPSKFGYALLNNNYDRFARKSPILKNNQILLSALTNGIFPEPIPGDTLTTTYQFDNVGRRVDRSSISLYSTLQRVNERTPTHVTSFYLDFSNIINSLGEIVILGGVTFNISAINLSKHQAFLHEIAFNVDSLPSAPGEYSINYTNGQVFVFGTQLELGTGSNPPVATYFYKDIATKNVDYFINDDGYNISLNAFSKFATQQFAISFLYEDVFSPDIDYIASTHVEVINERIGNRLFSDFGVVVNNSPVKDVHQVLNETTGETYTPGLVLGDRIYFTGNTPPKTSTTFGELAHAAIIDDEQLHVGIPTTTPNTLLKVFPVTLLNHPVLNQRQDGIGVDFNTSARFTRQDLFVNEFYFNPSNSVQLNLEKLHNVGDYLIDYSSGNIYLGVSNLQDFDVGHASYAYGAFVPAHTHVLDVTSIGIGTTSSHIIQDFDLGAIYDGLIVPKQLDYSYDGFDGISRVPNSDAIFIAQLQDDFTVYVKHPIKKVYGVYTQNYVDGYNATTLSINNLFDNSVNSFNGIVIDLKKYIVLPVAADVNPNYFSVIIPDDTEVVKSIVVVDTNIELLDTQLFVIKYNNIIIKTVVPSPLINPTTATITIQNIITLIDTTFDTFVDIAGNRFQILSLTGGNVLNVTVDNFVPPVVNIGSKILDHNGFVVAEHLNIISVLELPNLLYVLHYDVLPSGVLIGYKVQDYNGNVFDITDVQSGSVVVSVSSVIPITDPVARIETQSLLVSVGAQQTKLMLPLDTPITVGTNIKIGYVTNDTNNAIVAANAVTMSAGGAGMVIDYSYGQFFINYTHVDDEILVSYDWGDNQLDWSISDTLTSGMAYYVSYRYGASRDGLETNFGPLTNVNFLQSAPLSISRETYRTAVSAAIKAFLKGPTHEAIRLIAHAFTQIDPDIQEAILNQWIVGRDPLKLQDPKVTGQIVFGNGKYNDGLVITNNNSIQLPGASSLRLAQGTFSTWFRPNWGGSQADEVINFSLPTATLEVFYNAHNILPQDAPQNRWNLLIGSDAYGSAFVTTDYLEIRNSKNEYTSLSVPSNIEDGYLIFDQDGYDGYSISSTSLFHDAFTSFPYAKRIGKYIWQRFEPILCVVNDIDINFTGYVNKLHYINPSANSVKIVNVEIDDGYGLYDTGFYLIKGDRYTAEVVLQDGHLDSTPPFPNYSPPIVVSTVSGSYTATVISGDTSTLSVGQQVIIGSAYPTLTNIIGIMPASIVLRSKALVTLSSIGVSNLDPLSTSGFLDGYGEIHLRDKLGTRQANTTELRTNGWERQLLLKISITTYASTFIMIVGSNSAPLSTQTPVVDFLVPLIPGYDVVVDQYGNVFEIDHVDLPSVWLKIPSASGVSAPIGVITAFRKYAGVTLPDGALFMTQANWSSSTTYNMAKINGSMSFTINQETINSSYVEHYNNNTTGISGISFGQIDLNSDSAVRVESVNYNIRSLFLLSDVYVGNTGSNPVSNDISFVYDINNTGIPAINKNKYIAVFSSKTSVNDNEPDDQVFVKIKTPSSWTLSDGIATQTFAATPIIKFTASTNGDLIDIVDGYGMTYRKDLDDVISLTAIDTATYISGHSSVLLDNGPELRVAAGKRHYLFDVNTPEGALSLYRNGAGFLTAETKVGHIELYNIRADISSWSAGQLHHIAMSWKISSPDETDELHLFIDADEVPNEVTFGSNMQDGYIGQIYQEILSVILRVASIDGYIVNDSNGSGVFIPTIASVQPNSSWINKTIVLNATIPGPNVYLNEPLVVAAIVSVVGGELLFLSQNGAQIDFAIYGPSVPILYGLATSTTAITTILTRTNFGVFNNGVELNGPNSDVPEFRQVGNSQVIELYTINTTTGEYVEVATVLDTITIKTYGLLSQRIKNRVYQYGNLIRSTPIVLDTFAGGQITSTDIIINSGGSAFITDFPPPIDAQQVKVTKILLPRIMI